jgi:hypothetical protein
MNKPPLMCPLGCNDSLIIESDLRHVTCSVCKNKWDILTCKWQSELKNVNTEHKRCPGCFVKEGEKHISGCWEIDHDM